MFDRMNYNDKLLEIFYDADKYQQTSKNDVFIIHRKIQLFLENSILQGVINDSLFEFLNLEYPIIPLAFRVPKIHKSIDHPPLKVIIAAHNSPMYSLGVFVDRLLKDL